MQNPFDIVDDLFGYFMQSAELSTALGIAEGATIDVYDKKIRRTAADATLLDPNDTTIFPFIDYSCIPSAGQQKNMMVFKGVLEFNIWTGYMYDASVIYGILKTIIKTNFSDSDMVYAAAVASGIPDVYRFRFRMSVIIEA